MERLHKVSAGFVFAFLSLHFANHLIGLTGLDAHAQFMDAARLVYRHPVIEMAVLLAFVVQIITGIPLIAKIWREKKDFIHQLQAASGLVMIVFVLLHVAMIGIGRLVFNLDTNFYFAAAGLMTAPWDKWLYAFYGAGVFALFVHFGCIFYDIYKKTNKRAGWFFLALILLGGGYITWQLLMMYSGHLYPVTLPDDYTRLYGAS